MTNAPRPSSALCCLVALAALLGPGCGGNKVTGPSQVSIALAGGASLVAGGTLLGTVTLNVAAGNGGATVGLSSSNTSVATVPASVVVAQNAQTANFTVTGVAEGSANISAQLGTSQQSATLTVAAIQVSLVSASLSAGSVTGPTTVSGSVTISGPAPLGGSTIGLSSSNPSVATVPASVVVSPGAATAPFSVSALDITADASTTVTASLAGTQKAMGLTVIAAKAARFVVIPDPGTIATGQQCEVQKDPGSAINNMRCTFNASASTPAGITSYNWTFSEPAGPKIISTASPTLSGQSLACGSFGAAGNVADRTVKLEIVFPGGSREIQVLVTFVRNSPC